MCVGSFLRYQRQLSYENGESFFCFALSFYFRWVYRTKNQAYCASISLIQPRCCAYATDRKTSWREHVASGYMGFISALAMAIAKMKTDAQSGWVAALASSFRSTQSSCTTGAIKRCYRRCVVRTRRCTVHRVASTNHLDARVELTHSSIRLCQCIPPMRTAVLSAPERTPGLS